MISLRIFVLFFITGLFFSCNTAKKNIDLPRVGEIDQKFVPHISGFTGGLLSKKAPVIIELTDAYHEMAAIGKMLPNNLFTFSPAIDGQIIWENPYTVKFIPVDDLPSGQLYEVAFNLGKIKEVEESLQSFDFYFKVKDLNVQLFYDQFNNIGDDFVEIQGRVIATDYIDTSLLVKSVFLNMNAKEVSIHWKFGKDNVHHFYSEKIERQKEQISLNLVGESAVFGNKIQKNIQIPAKGDFKLISASSATKGAQHALLIFSEALDPMQDLRGMILLDGEEDLEFSITGNQLKIYPESQLVGEVELVLNKGIKSNAGFIIKSNMKYDIVFNELPPAVEILGEGTIVPTSDGAHFPFKAINLKAVDVYVTKINSDNIIQFLQENELNGKSGIKRVGKEIWRETILLDEKLNLKEWNNFAVDISRFTSEDPNSMYRVSISFKREHAIYNCETINNDLTFLTNEQNGWSESDWEVNNWYDYYDDYDYYYEDEYDWNNPCGNKFYRNKSKSKNVLVSDVGIIAKAGQDETLIVFVSNLKSTKPISNAKIELFSFQKELIATGSTDENGLLIIKSEIKPFAISASSEGQTTFMRLRDRDAKSVSKFDVEGTYVRNGVKGFIFTERDVRRPGDSIYIGFMLEDSRDVIPATHPVKFSLKNPSGIVVNEQTKQFSLNDLYDFRTATNIASVTGNYLAQIAIGNQVFSKSIKVETVKPNRLKVDLSAANKILSRGKKDQLTLFSQWLHGADASGLRGKVEMRLTGGYTRFEKFKKFHFDDPLKSFYARESVVFDDVLGSDGYKKFIPEINVNESAPGMLQATFISKVFEGGGEFSIDRTMFQFSPYESYVGLQTPKGELWGDALLTDKDQNFDLVLVDEQGKLESGDVELTIYKIDNNWWWDSYNRNISSYINRSSTTPIKKETISLKDGQGSFTYNVAKNDWGRYYFKISNKDGHSTGKLITFDWPYWARTNRKSDDNATMLGFSTDKEKYSIGEKVNISIPSPKTGRVLISIENGTKILSNYWLETSVGETQFSFETNAEMAPNVYVHVTLTQPHAETANDLPIRMYGVMPISVENPQTHITPVISMKDELKPESNAIISIRNEEKLPMTYTLAVVDEGLLDLTNFKTPDPWSHFYAKEALGVHTWDIYDDVLGAYGARIDQLLAIGGDAEINTKANPSANRFKPMVKYIGPFYFDGETTNKHEIKIPNYVGSVRVMVVGKGNQKNYGSAQKTVPVKSSVMVLATMPRVLGPGETVSIPVNVFNMDDEAKIVNVKIQSNELIEIVGDKELKARFLTKGDKIITFKARVKDQLGIGSVKVFASDDKFTARDEIELDVRPSNPALSWSENFVIAPGESLSEELKLRGIKGTNEASVEISSIPNLNLTERLGYLITYPHGCLEQTVSSGFPQLYLSKVLDTDPLIKEKMRANVIATLDRLQLYLMNNGGFSYWPGGDNTNEWASVYAGHFMAEAEKAGYNVPYYTRYRWINNQRNLAQNWTNTESQNSSRYNDLIQAYRLYVLSLMDEEDIGSMNRLKEKNNLTLQAKWRLAGAYALSGRKDIANNLIDAKETFELSNTISNTFGEETRDLAMILEVLTILNEDTKGMKLAIDIAQELSSEIWMSTQTCAFSLMSICKYINASGSESKIMNYAYQFDNEAILTKRTARSFVHHDLVDKNQPIKVTNNGDQKLFVSISHTGIPLPGTQSASQNVLSMDIKYYDSDSDSKALLDPSKIEQGTDFTMELTIKNDGTRGNLTELALSQIVPSGWEIHNSRLDGYTSSNAIDYQDIRDDRVYTYFDLSAGKSIVVKLKMNASYLGKFYLPGILAEDMYDADIHAFQGLGLGNSSEN